LILKNNGGLIVKLRTAIAALLASTTPALAGGIVSEIVNAPLSASGTVQGTRVGINVYLQSDAAQGPEFMDPAVVGYGIPAGGHMEIEMAGGFERDWGIGISQAAIMMVTGAPQQGLPGKAVGYSVDEGEDENVFLINPVDGGSLEAGALMTPAPGAKGDPIRQRGIKVIHIGFQQSAFLNSGDSGTVNVRIVGADGKVISEGSASVDFLATPVAQVLPTNFPQGMRNHNWQTVSAGTVVGASEGTIPLTYMLYGQAPSGDADTVYAFKGGVVGAGVLSTQQLNAAGFQTPSELSRYNGGLVVQDTNGDGVLDPTVDAIVGGIIGAAPAGATGQELKSLEVDGAVVLSQATEDVAEKPGKRWGGSMLQLQFTAGSASGKYQPTVALLADPSDLGSGDGSSYTYTVVVQ
jgi:hypothetical protein